MAGWGHHWTTPGAVGDLIRVGISTCHRRGCTTRATPARRYVPIAMVAAWLGHTDVSVTLGTYVHAQPEALLEAAQRFTRSSITAAD